VSDDAARHQARHDLLLVCSCGGHLLQLVALRPVWEARDRLWVTFDKSDSRSLLAGESVIHAFGPTNRNIPNLLRNLRLAVTTVWRVRPRVVLTTGAGVAVPFAWLARLSGARVIYVESFTRIETPSLSLRLIRPVADRVYVQWPDLAARYPPARFVGDVFGLQPA
jgi:beta-1,4-N-acetylglucosaminyltransferase